jgi:uncharacterized protein YcfL
MKCFVFAVSFVLITVAGCRNPQTSGSPFAGEAQLETHTRVGVNVEGRLNEDLTLDPAPFVGQFLPNQEVRINAVTAASNVQGLPQLQFTIQSQQDRPQAFQYRFVWLNADGFVQQPDQNPWQTVHLQGREVAFIGSTARSPDARSFQLMIRPLEFKK